MAHRLYAVLHGPLLVCHVQRACGRSLTCASLVHANPVLVRENLLSRQDLQVIPLHLGGAPVRVCSAWVGAICGLSFGARLPHSMKALFRGWGGGALSAM